jgi:hypothetical protein
MGLWSFSDQNLFHCTIIISIMYRRNQKCSWKAFWDISITYRRTQKCSKILLWINFEFTCPMASQKAGSGPATFISQVAALSSFLNARMSAKRSASCQRYYHDPDTFIYNHRTSVSGQRQWTGEDDLKKQRSRKGSTIRLCDMKISVAIWQWRRGREQISTRGHDRTKRLRQTIWKQCRGRFPNAPTENVGNAAKSRRYAWSMWGHAIWKYPKRPPRSVRKSRYISSTLEYRTD